MDGAEPRWASDLAFRFRYQVSNTHGALFAERLLGRGLCHERSCHWDSEAVSLDAVLDHAIHSSRLGWGSAAVLELEEPGCLALVWLSRGVVTVNLAAATLDALAAGEKLLRDLLPLRTPSDDQTVPISFWSYASHGPSAATRSVDVPSWADIRGNYPRQVREQLDPLMQLDSAPTEGGQLILWYGEPGTGKTYGLRALAWQWRDWCSFHYVVDPDTFFGRSDYMLEVLLGEDDEDESRWRILLLEDTGELLAADAKMQAGQRLSRLLNVVDGMIGQGLRVLVLVTTNDDLRRLHPAVTRPGRCLARVEFLKFGPDEAGEWLERRGVDNDERAGTLAVLFATAAGDAPPERPLVGFVR
jgi:hypothetical protein